MDFRYSVVDVFTSTPLEGNPLAVFPDARAIAPELMQRIARELNLSETTFVLPAERDTSVARVRIFTPTYEMPFAGHPTIGTAAVIRRAGTSLHSGSGFVLDEGVGPVTVRFEDGADSLIWLTTPQIVRGTLFGRRAWADAIGLSEDDLIADLPCQIFSAGNPNVFIPVKDAQRVDQVQLDTARVGHLLAGESAPTCVFVFAPVPTGAYSRMFAPALGIFEDPATGSATGPLAAFMMEHRLVASEDGTQFVSEQGTKMGRRSLLHVHIRGAGGTEAIEVGGHVAFVADGTMRLPDAA